MTILRPINVFKQFRMHVEYLLPTFFQPAFTCSKLTLETPENSLEYVQSYNKDNTAMSVTPFWYLYYSLWTDLIHRFDVSFVEFEQVHAGWDYVISLWWIRQNPYLKEQLDALIFWVCNLIDTGSTKTPFCAYWCWFYKVCDCYFCSVLNSFLHKRKRWFRKGKSSAH